ncbi:MAG: ABC transporter ATP-binding protein [Myxococcota bacterium]|nr:ABC transporter ATP-binding protein [Myxococcota bacterium]
MSIVSVEGLTRDYAQGEHTVHALRGVDLSVESGEFLALMGASGSGKTTLLNLIGGLDEPTAGEVHIEGQPLSGIKAAVRSDLRRDRIGFVFQAYNLVPVLTAVENTEMVLLLRGVAPAERRDRAMKMLAAVGLEGMEHRLPSELSGGQQQRVAVARAIAGEPALVLADEPTANLDSTTSNELIDLMSRLNREQGITFVFATHDPKVMAAARRVVMMEDGLIKEDQTK